jgi:sugar phosphate isomerase/epimerase
MKNVASIASRRKFLAAAGAAGAGAALGVAGFPQLAAAQEDGPLYKISLAEWSLVRGFSRDGKDNLRFPEIAKNEYGIDAVEYVDQFFSDKAKDMEYLGELKKRCDDLEVRSVLIMVDTAGSLGEPDDAARTKAVENHYKWVEASKYLGGHSIRVNARSEGSREEQAKLAADGLRRLSEFSAQHEMNVLVENHGGYSSDGAWLAGVMKAVNLPNCGTLPDFGNFGNVPDLGNYDRYMGVTELMPFAKAVSAKTYGFDEQGNETTIDYKRMMKIVVDAGYRGYVGVEWEGRELAPPEGIKLTKQLLERVRDELSAEG